MGMEDMPITEPEPVLHEQAPEIPPQIPPPESVEPSLDRMGEKARKVPPFLSVLALMGSLGITSPEAPAADQPSQTAAAESVVDDTRPSFTEYMNGLKARAGKTGIELLGVATEIDWMADGPIDDVNDRMTNALGAELAESYLQERLEDALHRPSVTKRLEGLFLPEAMTHHLGDEVVTEVIDSLQSKLTQPFLQSFRKSIETDPSRADLSYALDKRNANNMPVQYDLQRGNYTIKLGTDLSDRIGFHIEGKF